MEKNYRLGAINGHIVGRILKETVRRATVVIRNERAVFEIQKKKGYSGKMDDVFSSADTKTQEIYLQMIRECFPNCGVVAEEKRLKINPKNGCTAYFTVDPLDGTKAYIRRQSHGVGTMIALVGKGEVISAYIGDINTEEFFGYRPGSNSVHRITKLDTIEKLEYVESLEGRNPFALLREVPNRYHPDTRRIIENSFGGDYGIDGGSIGTWMARLWKREVRAVFLDAGVETPWDATPIIGISLKLGYKFLKNDISGKLQEYSPRLSKIIYKRDHDTIVIHQKDLKLLKQ